jgi:hypothetical protein
LAEVQQFVLAHPVETLRVATAPPTDGAASEGEVPGIGFRFTRATAKDAAAVVIKNPGEGDHPAIDLVRLFAKFRDAPPPVPPLVCRYLQAIPQNATILLAHPNHRAVELWARGEEFRVRVEPPLADDPRAPEASRWYAWRDGTWIPAEAPDTDVPVSATRPAATRRTEPAAGKPVFPLLPRRPSTSELLAQVEARPEPLPREEQWYAEPRAGHTVFTHYVPLLGNARVPQGESVQMILPGLEFDTAHMALNGQRTTLYVLHDGQVIALPLPGGVRATTGPAAGR